MIVPTSLTDHRIAALEKSIAAGDDGALDQFWQEVATAGAPLMEPVEGIRATVIGASQYTIQVSGSTIFVSPPDTLPLRNVPVIAPNLPLSGNELDANAIAAETEAAQEFGRETLHDHGTARIGQGDRTACRGAHAEADLEHQRQ